MAVIQDHWLQRTHTAGDYADTVDILLHTHFFQRFELFFFVKHILTAISSALQIMPSFFPPTNSYCSLCHLLKHHF